MRRGVVVLGLIAAVGLAGCSGSAAAPPAPQAPARSTPSPVPAAMRTLAQNRENARQSAIRALATMPTPAGSSRRDVAPTPVLVSPNGGTGPADPRLQQRGWWVVPMREAAFRTWLRRHHPVGLRLPNGMVDGGSSRTGSVLVHTTDYVGRSTPAHTPVTLMLDYVPTRTGTAVLASTWVSARRPRPTDTFVSHVTAVDVRWRPDSIASHPPKERHRHLVSARPGDRAAIAALRRAVNGLLGSPETPLIASCPMVRYPGGDTVTFTMGGTSGPATLSFRLAPFCFGQVTVVRNHRRVGTTLDPGRFHDVVRRLVGAPR